MTPYHAKFYAHEPSCDGGEGVDRLGRALFDASVDLNPDQIEAALFALRNPLSKGVLLADEVGLGKTIEAGLVLCQYWAERKRRLLIITPASLRKQWALELDEKFNLQSVILDFFAGSGTTGDAVMNLNREDGGDRKYILIEMGEHFETVLVPRLKKVICWKDWKDGKPQNRKTGISHCLKILRLESYEDTLNNLRLHRSRAQELALEAMTPEAREQYQLGYMLDLEASCSQSLLNVSASPTRSLPNSCGRAAEYHENPHV